MSVLLEFSMFPTDQGESVSAHVSPIIEMIDGSGVDYRLTPMGTVIETETLREAMDIVERAYAVLDARGCKRVYSSLKLDIRKGRSQRMIRKIASVKEKIGEVRA